jgi:outer membrane protein
MTDRFLVRVIGSAVVVSAGVIAPSTSLRASPSTPLQTGPSPPLRASSSTASAQQPASQTSQPVSEGSDTLQLTLDDAVRRAVENNPDLAIVRLGTEIEAARVRESSSAFVPVLSSVVGRSRNVSPPSNFLLGNGGLATNDVFSSTGVRQRSPWGGGTWNVSWETSRTTSNSPLSSFDPSLQSGLQVAFSQPLLKNRSIDGVRHQYIIAKRNQDSSELRFRESMVQTVASVKQAYWTLKASLANVTVQQRSLELAQELVNQNQIRVDVGQTPPLDLVQAQAEVAQRRENLIRASAAAEDAEDRLRRLIMDPADPTFWRTHINPADEPAGRVPLPDVDAAVSKALAERYDVARARNEQGSAAANVEFFKNQKLPDVRVETSYRGSGAGGTQLLRSGFPGVITGRLNTDFGDVLNQVFRSEYPTWSVGLTVNYALGRSFEAANLVRAEIERRQAGQRIASLQLQAAETIRQAARQVRSTAEREDAARAGATFAGQRFDAEQRRYQVGLSTTFLVTQAQRDLLQAQVNLLQATLDYQSSLVNFEALQLAPSVAAGETFGLAGASIVLLPAAEPRGVFRQSAGGGF